MAHGTARENSRLETIVVAVSARETFIRDRRISRWRVRRSSHRQKGAPPLEREAREKRNELGVNFRDLEVVSAANVAYRRIKLAEECGWKERGLLMLAVRVTDSFGLLLNVMRDTC